MKNLICIEFSDPHWIEVVDKVVKGTRARPVYWTGAAGREKDVCSAFPGIVFHENLLAVRGVNPAQFELSGLRYPDAAMLDELLETQTITLKMMDRMDPTGHEFGYEERLRHYYRLVAYWHSVLEKFNPAVVLMPISPHMIYDFVLFGLCKRLGVPTLLFDRTAIPGRVLPMNDYRNGSQALRSRYELRLHDGAPPIFSDFLKQYLTSIRGDYVSGMAPNFKLKMDRLALNSVKGISKPSLLQVVRHELRGIIQNLTRQKLRVPRSYLKLREHPPEKRSVGHVGYYMNRWRGIGVKLKLMHLYESIQKAPDFNVPYVFVALHFQPERSTVPLGGLFADQLLLIAQLANALPTGWKIYVKEHSWQLQPYSRGQHSRNTLFYEDVSAIPNVEFVPINIPSFELIDHSIAVATVAGSVGWEGVNRGKPALIFGDAWYQDCEGVYRVYSSAEIRKAIRDICLGVVVDHERVSHFIAALDEVALRAVLEFNLEAKGEVTLAQSIESLANSYIERIQAI